MNKETPTVKEKAIYQAVVDLFMEGADLSGSGSRKWKITVKIRH